MTALTFNVPAPVLSTVATVPAGQPFMLSTVADEVYQAVGASSGGVRDVRRMSTGFVDQLADATAVFVVSITDATIGPA